MSNMAQGTKMTTPRELYRECLGEGELQKKSSPRFCYLISMDIRKKAAQATVEEFTKPTPTLVSNSTHVDSDSDTSSYGGQDASNSQSPSLLH